LNGFVSDPFPVSGGNSRPLRIKLGRTCPNLGEELEIILKKVHAVKVKAKNQMLANNTERSDNQNDEKKIFGDGRQIIAHR
jgi:hypothetical protein